MPITDEDIIAITKQTVMTSFFNFFVCKEDVKTRHILLYKLFPEESNIRSVMGGLETSLGTTLWERIASQIAKMNGFEVLNPKVDFVQPTVMPVKITNLIAKHKDIREVANANVPIANYIKELSTEINALGANEIPASYKKLTKGSGVDIFLRKDHAEYAFDLKTVQINAGSGTKFNETLMKWLAFSALYQKHAGTNYSFNAHIVIPYDPHTESNWWTEFGERAYPLDKTDILLADEFWDLISGRKNTLAQITKAFNQLANDGFQDIYKDFFHKSGITTSIELLKKIADVSFDDEIQPATFTKKVQWKCNACDESFKSSIKGFQNLNCCPNCEKVFLN
jgi:hypothetical protein